MARIDKELHEQLKQVTETVTAANMDELIQSLVAPLQEQKAELVETKAAARAVIDAADLQIRKLDGMLRAAGAIPKPGPKQQQVPTSTSPREFEDKLARVAPIIVAEGGEWSVPRVRERFHFSDTTARNILFRLRADEVLRLVGTKGAKLIYRLHDDVEVVDAA